MDITTSDVYTNVEGYVISEFNHLNNGKIFRVYTDKLGLISIYSKNIELYYSFFSRYYFKLFKGNDFFYCIESELLEYNFLKNKEYILFLNVLTEIILKSSLQELKNEDIFTLITEVVTNYKKFDHNLLLLYFIIKYMNHSGYHIVFEEFDKKNTFFNIVDFEVRNFSDNFFDKKYNYKINFNEYKLILLLNRIEFLNSISKYNFDVNYLRLLGIFVNALCYNFNVYELNTFGLFN